MLVVLSGCTSVSNYCHERPVVCASVSALVVAGIVMSVSGDDDKSVPPANKPPLGQVPSDARLKRDIRYAETLPNGIRLYSFRYWNDSRVFAGVMAQELLQDARYRHAVHETDRGYYRVDLTALGLRMDGAVEQYVEAGEAALRKATPL